MFTGLQPKRLVPTIEQQGILLANGRQSLEFIVGARLSEM
jgi:hypothetical protein